MFDISLPWASFWYDAFNVLLFVGAFAVAVGTYGSIKMGAVKERFSDERTTALEAQTEQAKAELGIAQADIAKANAQIAEANAREKEASESLERLRLQTAPRTLDLTKLTEALSKARAQARVEIRFSKDQPEPWWFANEVFRALLNLKWDASWPTEITPEDIPPHSIPGVPPMSGLLLVSNNQNDLDDPNSALGALMMGLLASTLAVHASFDPKLPDGVVRLLVSPRVLILFKAQP